VKREKKGSRGCRKRVEGVDWERRENKES